MPLDPEIANILNFMAQAGAPSMSAGTVEQARVGFRAGTVGVRDPATLAAVRSVEDITVPGADGPRAARVYRPDADGALPTMVFFHGGGFVIGDIETHDDQARLICRDGAMVVVSIDYRLAPEHPFPAGYEDCLAATRWAADNVATLGDDADRLVVGGDSAGGNLAAAVALTCRTGGPALAAQFLIYPGVDFAEDADYPSRVENAEGYFLTAEDMLWFSGLYLPADADTSDPRMSPIRATDLAGVAPAVLGVGEFDPLRDEDLAYGKALADAGVRVVVRRYDGLIHGYFGLGTFSAAAADATTDMINALRDVLS
ncbi:MAG TPA: alpha/beta hydrolase [Mycobacteriales bacterium]|jgi:acetyl esterase|nr:alpha/beta hydrolase [Mycobacteriales bacterium]